MAINRYNSPIKTNYRDTYVSQHVDLPYQAIAQKLARDQADYDKAEVNYDNLKFKDELLTEDQGASSALANKLVSDLDRVLEENDGNFAAVNEYIAKTGKTWDSHVGSAGHKFAEENKANVEAQKKALDKDGGTSDQSYYEFQRNDFGSKGGSWAGAKFKKFNTIGNHNWLDEAAKNVGLLKASGSTTSTKGLSPDEMYKTYVKKGGKGVSAQDYRDVMTASLNANEDFKTYVDRELEMIQSRLKNPLTDDQINQYKQKKINDVIGGTDKALAWQEVVDESGVDLTSFGNSVKKDEYDEEKSQFTVKYNMEAPENDIRNILAESDGTTTFDDVSNYLKNGADAFMRSDIFGEDPHSSKVWMDSVKTDVFDGKELDPAMQTSFLLFASGERGKNNGMTFERRSKLEKKWNELSPKQKEEAEYAAKQQLDVYKDWNRSENLVIDQLTKEGHINEFQANMLKDYGDVKIARDKATRLANKNNDKLLSNEIREYDAVNRLMSSQFIGNDHKRISMPDEEGNWVTKKVEDLSGTEKRILEEYFTFDKRDQYEDVQRLEMTKNFEIPKSIKVHMPPHGTGGSYAGSHFTDNEKFWTGFGQQTLGTNARDRHNELMRDRIEQSGASTTKHGVGSSKTTKTWGYNPKTNNMFNQAVERGSVKNSKGATVSRQELSNKFEEEFAEKFEEDADNPTKMKAYVNDRFSQVFGSPVREFDLSSNQFKIVYGDGDFFIPGGDVNDSIIDVTDKGDSLSKESDNAMEYVTAVNDSLNKKASTSIGGTVFLTKDEDVMIVSEEKNGETVQVVKVNGDDYGYPGRELEIRRPAAFREELGYARYLKSKGAEKMLEEAYGSETSIDAITKKIIKNYL